MIQTLMDLQPVILLGLLMLMYSMESFWPYLAKPLNKKQHDIHNVILILINFLVNGALSVGVMYMVLYTHNNQLGLLHLVDLPVSVEAIIGILLIDLGSYGVHVGQHKVPLLWRFHRVHHSDLALNTTSSLRFHPMETVLTQGLYFCIAVPVFGVSLGSFVMYGTLAVIFVVIQHSNVKFPDWIEKYGRFIFATPGWHKIHHADESTMTNSHYGSVFTFWDRMFGTYHRISPEEIHYGLKEFRDSERQKVGFLLRSPFVDVSKKRTPG